MSPIEVVISCSVVLLGGGVSIAAFRHMKGGFGPYNLRAAVLPLVITLSVLLALSGKVHGDAAIGLLGAVAGYLFGLKEGRSTGGRRPGSGGRPAAGGDEE